MAINVPIARYFTAALCIVTRLEEHGDERAEWVRRIASRGAHSRQRLLYSPSTFAELYARRSPIKAVCESFYTHQNWFDAVMALADAHLHWNAQRDRLVSKLDEATQEMLFAYERGHSSRQIADQLGHSEDHMRRWFEQTIRSLRRKLRKQPEYL